LNVFNIIFDAELLLKISFILVW